MAFADTQTTATHVLQRVGRPFAAIGNFLIKIAERNALAQEVNALNSLTDTELAEKGTSRPAQVEKIFRAHLYM